MARVRTMGATGSATEQSLAEAVERELPHLAGLNLLKAGREPGWWPQDYPRASQRRMSIACLQDRRNEDGGM